MTEPDYTDDGVPTFDHVRDKIENRNLTTDAAAELTGDPQQIQDQFERREQAGRDRLEEIRRSLGGN